MGFVHFNPVKQSQEKMRILLSTIICLFIFSSFTLCAEPVNIGDSRQLFLDDFLIAEMNQAELRVHQPQRQEQFIVFDAPWEGDAQNYFTVIFDGESYHMYYHAWGQNTGTSLSIAYMKSKDGIHWERPNLGIYEHNGSKDNNIVMWNYNDVLSHDMNPFVDKNPKTTPEARFKAVGYMYGSPNPENNGLYAFCSNDAVHWKVMSEKPVFTGWAFDTQNVAFWSEKEGKYVLYFRHFRERIRVIRRAVSEDFLNWKDDGEITFPEGQGPSMEVQFYTNQIAPYYRNPDLYIGFPARYVDRGLTVSTDLLPELEWRKKGISVEQRIGTTVTDTVFISSRDGYKFTQGNDAFVQPGLRTRHNWFYGDNYLAWGLIETDSLYDDSPRELSLWSVESYQTDGDSRLRRYTLRIDGFCSLHAKSRAGIVATKPLVFQGKELSLNATTSAAGTIRIEICDENGNVIPGFSAEDCDIIYGDSLDRRVSWKGNRDISSLQGKPIVLRFLLKEADVYSLKWEN